MEVIADPVIAEPLQALGVGMPDAIIVDIHCRIDGTRASSCHGLDAAIQRVDSRQPIILMSWFPRSHFNLDRKLHYLLGHLNCEFVRLPANMDDIRDAYGNIKYALSPAADDEHEYCDDKLCLALLDLRDQQSEQKVLLHDLANARRNGQMAEWLIRAREAEYVGSDEEIIAAVESNSLPKYTPFIDRSFRGSFVDLDGTLFKKGELDQETLKLVKSLPGRITLWTGGELELWAKMCREHGLPWKVMSKWLFQGAKVEVAIDDQSLDELTRTYGFTAERFRQV